MLTVRSDALTLRDASALSGQHDLQARLPLYSTSVRLAIPLPRGPKKQHPVQPADEILRCEILVVHGYENRKAIAGLEDEC